MTPVARALTNEEPTVEASRDEVDLQWLYEWGRRQDPVRVTLLAMMAVWSLVFIYLGWIRHVRYATFGFDLGLYDQPLWLLSRFEDPFVTLRGLDFWGTHLNPVLLLFVPFYWLGAGPLFLLVVQVLVQASGAAAVYLLARDRLGERWPAVALGAVLLLHPTYQYLVWEFFHPDALAVAPLLFAYWAARAKRWRLFAVAVVLALACKEDVALAVVVLGILIAIRGDRRIGLITAAASAAWFMIATRVIIPVANGIGPFYDTFFGELGGSVGEVAGTLVRNPSRAVELASRPDRVNYYRMMLAPVAFIPLLSPATLLIAGPMVGVNILSSFPYVREIRYHYSALVLAAIVLATVEAIAWLGTTAARRTFMVGLVVATSLAATVAWGPSPISTKYESGLWPLGPDPRLPAKKAAAALVPDRAPATVHYYFAPQMAHREKIYEWPAPWKPANWGVHGENLHDPADVRWLVLDRTLLSADDKILVSQLLSREFVVRFDQNDIVVAERVAAPPPAP